MSSQRVIGFHAIEKLIKQAPEHVYHVTFLTGAHSKRQQALLDRVNALGIPVRFEGKRAFDSLDGNHQGVMADVAPRKNLTEKDLLVLLEETDQPLFLFLDEIQDPHNLGAILRTADATGVDAVVVPKHQSVGLTETVRKVACGAADTVSLIVVSNLVRTMKDCQKAGMWLTGLAGETNKNVYQADFKGSVGLVMGAEGTGLRKLTRETCDQLVAIPMKGDIESLNVSVATGVALYEVVRQRSLA